MSSVQTFSVDQTSRLVVGATRTISTSFTFSTTLNPSLHVHNTTSVDQTSGLVVATTRTTTSRFSSSTTSSYSSSLANGTTSTNTRQPGSPSWHFILVGGAAGSAVAFLILAFIICRRRLRRSKLDEAIHPIEPFFGPSKSIPPVLHQGKHQAVAQVPMNSPSTVMADRGSQLSAMRPAPSLKSFRSAPPSYRSGPGALWASGIIDHYPVPSPSIRTPTRSNFPITLPDVQSDFNQSVDYPWTRDTINSLSA